MTKDTIIDIDVVSAPLAVPGASKDSKERLRLWITLLHVSRSIEAELRGRLRRNFKTTLPRFEVMAALYQQPEGARMGDLSRLLLVTNGNVTEIVGRLVSQGLVSRAKRNGDRRASMVRLTRSGVTRFESMATAHEAWVREIWEHVGEDKARRLAAMLRAFCDKRRGKE